MASPPRNRPPPPAPTEPAPEQQPKRRGGGLWLGRWVMVLAIVAFLAVYVIQIARGSGLLYTVLFAGAAMAVAGLAGIAIRQLVLHSAAHERAGAILQQVEEREGGRRDAEQT